ncbi:Spo0E like sporulation regulatory protein [Paenibacillus algorifonticola]|uniref:Spo0E like sporulation regulatory protein n=1 Tax=Paenibacillus algorifonticola TaxID=684063 RepID=A0A1I2EHL1_9BACL|nr:aspartyl-phosphate phosphatase Spo0E family protein [Paenibacillus algorifonticola]SFE92452.1 Spo0E like sporulation regulatory protein [Paenibacillus algorifonticola]
MDKQLLLEMEKLRDKMVETALIKQTFLNREVLRLSQSLDVLIVRAQEERRTVSSHK